MNGPSERPGRGALAGVRILEIGGLETLYAGKLLADQGADVVLAEPAGGHPSRRQPPYAPDSADDTSSIDFTYLNGNKRSVALPAGDAARAEVASLVAGADLVLAGGRPDDLIRLGLDPAGWAGPPLVAITPFGFTGPWSRWQADEFVLNALGGMMSLGGYVDSPPLAPPAGQLHRAAGLFAAVAAVAALRHPEQTPFVDVSVHECGVMGLENAAQFVDLEGLVRGRTGGVDSQVGRGVYACKDGYVYLMLGLSAGSAFWRRFLAWLDDLQIEGREALQGEEWLQRSHLESDQAKAAFRAAVRPLFEDRTKDELYAACRERGIPLAPVSTIADLLRNEQLLARNFFVEVPASDWRHGPATAPGAPYRMARSPWAGRYAPPDLGADTAAVRRDWSPRPRPRAGSPAEPWVAGSLAAERPLAGVRVVDFSWVGAGAYTTRILADLGADVVKIESSTRVDQIRMSPPFRDGVPGVNRSGYFADRNASKRSITVNLKHAAGRELALDLIASAHIVANNFSPGTMERLGLGYDQVRERRPDVIYLEMSMQGRDGPHAEHVGYGLTIAALAGLHSLVGLPGRPPIGTGTNYPDHIPSPGHAAFAVLCALHELRRSGQGQRIEISQTEATVALLGTEVMAESIGIPQVAQANLNRTALLSGVFPTQGEDRWIAVSIRGEPEWGALRTVLGLGDLPLADTAEVREQIAAATRGRDRYELMESLQAAGVAAGVVQTAQDVVELDRQLAHRGHWVRIPHEEAGEFLYNSLPFRIAGTEVAPRLGAPLLGQHTDQVLREAGRSDLEIAELHGLGALA